MGLWDNNKNSNSGIWGGNSGIWGGSKKSSLFDSNSGINNKKGGLFDRVFSSGKKRGKGIWNPVDPWTKRP